MERKPSWDLKNTSEDDSLSEQIHSEWIIAELQAFFFLRHIQGSLGKLNARCWSTFFKAPYQNKQEVCRASWRIFCTVAATVRLEAPCMMPCNTPLYKSMWRLFSLLYQHAQDFTSFWFLHFFLWSSSCPLGFFLPICFHQKCTGYLLLFKLFQSI